MNDFGITDDDKVRKFSSLNDLSQLIFPTGEFFLLNPSFLMYADNNM
jgi:hypothetical protein